jgi:Tfp pilus assembly major pilin PilA
MRTLPIFAIALTAVLAAGCNKAKSPDSVAKDVSEAQQKASTNVADSQADASKDIAQKADKVDDKMTDLGNTAAKGAYDVALAKADGNRKIALAKCDALNGDDQKNCKNQADAEYETAKADAKAAETSDKQ